MMEKEKSKPRTGEWKKRFWNCLGGIGLLGCTYITGFVAGQTQNDIQQGTESSVADTIRDAGRYAGERAADLAEGIARAAKWAGTAVDDAINKDEEKGE